MSEIKGVPMLALMMLDNKLVHFMSTYHDATIAPGTRERWCKTNKVHLQLAMPKVKRDYDSGKKGGRACLINSSPIILCS